MAKKDPLKVLRFLFIVHFIFDVVFALPLMLFPVYTLTLFGWQSVDVIGARLVAAALFGIGIESLFARNSTKEQFKPMLNLKVIWSFSASAGILVSMLQGAHNRPFWGWVILAIFIGFNFIWTYWRLKINKI